MSFHSEPIGELKENRYSQFIPHGVSLGNDGLVGEIYETELAQNDFVAVLQFLAIHSLTVHVCAVQAPASITE